MPSLADFITATPELKFFGTHSRHYTRHVESEININRAFKRVQDKT
jgi:hypothetical protein